MRTIIIILGLIVILYFLNKKINPEYLLIKTLMNSAIAVLSIILVAVVMLHF